MIAITQYLRETKIWKVFICRNSTIVLPRQSANDSPTSSIFGMLLFLHNLKLQNLTIAERAFLNTCDRDFVSRDESRGKTEIRSWSYGDITAGILFLVSWLYISLFLWGKYVLIALKYKKWLRINWTLQMAECSVKRQQKVRKSW